MDGLQQQANNARLYERIAELEARLNSIDRLLKTAVETMAALAATESALLDAMKAVTERTT